MNFKRFCLDHAKFHMKHRMKPNTDSLIFMMMFVKKGKVEVASLRVPEESPMNYAQQVIDNVQPDCYLICSEAWCVQKKPEDYENYKKNYRHGIIEKDPDRYEAMFFLGKTRDGKEEFARHYKILRDSNNNIVNYQKMITGEVETSKLT